MNRTWAKGKLAAISVASLVLVCIASGLALRLHYARRQQPFAAACLAIPRGAPMVDVETAFTRIGERFSSRSYGRSGPGAPPQSYAFYRRTGLSRWQQCTIDVDESTQHVTSADLSTGTDFTHCSDRRSHPRRYWLCAIGDFAAP